MALSSNGCVARVLNIVFQHHTALLPQQDELYGLEGRPLGPGAHVAGAGEGGGGEGPVPPDAVDEDGVARHFGPQWVLLRFDQPVTAPKVGVLGGIGRTCRAIAVREAEPQLKGF